MSSPHSQYRPPFTVSSLRLLSAALLLSLFSFSCKGKKKATATTTTTANGCSLENKGPRTLSSDMKKSEFRFTWLSAHLDCDYKDDSTSQKFDMNLRMKRDSAIWLNITDATIGVRVARALITTDSVKFVKYLGETQCFQGDFAYISRMLNTEVDFEMLQAVLIGNSATFYEEDEKLHVLTDQERCAYILSTVRKRKLRRALEGQKPLNEPLQNITLDPKSFKILVNLFRDFETNRTFEASYSDFGPVDSVQFAHKEVFTIADTRKRAVIEAVFSKVNTTKALTFPFSIPDDCVPVQIKQH